MAAEARIYCPPKTAMQSGWAGTHEWVLVFEPQKAQRPDPLMGWIGRPIEALIAAPER